MKTTFNNMPNTFLAILIGISSLVLAIPTTVPEGLVPGDHYRLVFVTTGLHNASSTAIADYDTFVASQAISSPSLAALGITWSVLGSTANVDATTHTGTDPLVSAGVPVYNLNGQLVASGNADLWDGTLAHAINVDQDGNILAGATFTGTGIDGLGLLDRELGANGARVQFGDSGLTNSGWTTIDWSGTLSALHFYGISDVLEVQGVPEPATVVLLAFGGLMLRRKK